MSFVKSYFDYQFIDSKTIGLTVMFQWFSLLSRKSYHNVLVNLEKNCISKMNKMSLSADEILFHIHIH